MLPGVVLSLRRTQARCLSRGCPNPQSLLVLALTVALKRLYGLVRESYRPALAVLRGGKARSALCAGRVRATRRTPASRSRSSHRNPSSSPISKPAVTASTYSASSLSPRAADRRERASSLLNGYGSWQA